MAAIALALVATMAIVALKLLISLLWLPFELIGSIGGAIGALAGGLLKFVVAFSLICLIGVGIGLALLVLLPIAGLSAIALALVS